MTMTDISIVKRYIRTCNDGWLQGWHERNGGNLTYRMTDEELEQARQNPVILHAYRFLGDFPWHKGNKHPANALFDKYTKNSASVD